MDLVELRLSPVIDGMKNAHGYALRGGCLIQMSLGKFFTLTSLDALWPAYVTPTHFDAIPKHESDPERKFRESDPSVSFDVALFGIKGNARFVYLAQSEGLGPKSANENAGPTARPFSSSVMLQNTNCRTFGPYNVVASLPSPAGWAR